MLSIMAGSDDNGCQMGLRQWDETYFVDPYLDKFRSE